MYMYLTLKKVHVYTKDIEHVYTPRILNTYTYSKSETIILVLLSAFVI